MSQLITIAIVVDVTKPVNQYSEFVKAASARHSFLNTTVVCKYIVGNKLKLLQELVNLHNYMAHVNGS